IAWLVLALAAGLLILGLRRERERGAAIKQELNESESRYRSIFETAVDAIIVSDQHGIIREFSKAAEAMTGYRAAELVGQNMRLLLPPGHAAGARASNGSLLVDCGGAGSLPQGRVRLP